MTKLKRKKKKKSMKALLWIKMDLKKIANTIVRTVRLTLQLRTVMTNKSKKSNTRVRCFYFYVVVALTLEGTEDDDSSIEVYDAKAALAAQINGILNLTGDDDAVEVDDDLVGVESDPDEADNEVAYETPTKRSPHYSAVQFVLSPVRSVEESDGGKSTNTMFIALT